ncbi:hypothetical protein C1I90_04145 [Akkermansia muciniphila]|nr:hypothetical protein C1I90_04145 [Akkermansia muciniphila]
MFITETFLREISFINTFIICIKDVCLFFGLGIRRGIKRTDAETYGKPFPAWGGKGPTITK